MQICKYLKEGKSTSEISQLIGCNPGYVSQHRKKLNLPSTNKKFDWNEIQQYYDDGHSINESRQKFNFAMKSIYFATKKGRFKPRAHKDACILHAKIYSGRKQTPEEKDKMSQLVKNKVKNGTWHYSFSKIRTHKYNSKYAGDVLLQGSWELAYAKYLDDNDIEWKRPKDKFYYEYEKLKSGNGFYIPDFYLVGENKYIEIKGYETDKDRAKWKWFPLKLEIIKGKQLEEMKLIEKYK